ncbi:hypothetical protein [Sulfoacidibacillus ferrooxidans]|uniref:Copper amine oxidase-like N-terminal domain-containing protein n=1 Tax=Sulfoacidibacillus ferrooxidans TaxID=2005001 RepID=A0A9X2ADH7_9BACL|nr:hypothetical protein [Sulfoacidibacillus ferrooxidans]MCI0184914.1 hypothetical protein [Sulfoacidibacillus ferrooxidans]
MKSKVGWTCVIVAGAVSAQTFMPIVAHASTLVELSLTPQHVVSNDPWSGKPTSWVPLYNLQETLHKVGVQTTWNGNTLDVTAVPNGWSEITLNELGKGTTSANQMQFSMGGNQNAFVRAPKLIAKDPASGVKTTYVPVYYANLFLANQLTMFAQWGGTTWDLSPQDTVGQRSGSKSGTEEDYKTLNVVEYSSSEIIKLQNIAHQQSIKAYIPSKMGGPSGWYVPGAPAGADHAETIPFEDMSFYEASSWNGLIQSSYFTSTKSKLTIDRGGSYTLSGGQQGQWYTLKYSDGAREDLFVLREGNTWVGIVPNAAKSTIPELVQAVAETLQPMS